MKISLLTDAPLNVDVGGLERAGIMFMKWMINDFNIVFNINKKNFIKKYKKLLNSDLILIVGHRSIFILLIAFLLILTKRRIAWCAFWHNYKLEKNNNLLFYKFYDLIFKYLYKKSQINLVVSDYEAKQISNKNICKKVILPTFISCKEEYLKTKRHIDVLIPGRDVPHKRFKLIRKICEELGLNYFETCGNYLTEKELMKAYLSSKYIFVPSLYESYSYVALEGMCCGCNVLVSDAVMIKDLFFEYENFKVLEISKWNSVNVQNKLNEFPSNIQNIETSIKIQNDFSIDFCKKKFIKSLNL